MAGLFVGLQVAVFHQLARFMIKTINFVDILIIRGLVLIPTAYECLSQGVSGPGAGTSRQPPICRANVNSIATFQVRTS
jgi:hypothetical protein